jgi:hypothetical protein
MRYNCCFFLNFVPLHIESPYNFGVTGPILFLLIFNKRVPKFTFVLVLTYHVNHSLKGAPHLFVILTVIGSFDIDA